jgi:cell division protein FtsB
MKSLQLNSIWQSLRSVKVSGLEAFFLVLALGFAGYVGYYYYNSVKPLYAQIEEIQAENTNWQSKQVAERERLKKLETQRVHAEQIKNSLFTFETYLKNSNTGKAAIIDEFEALSKKHKILTGDFGFKPVEAQPLVDENGQLLKEAMRNDKINVYPALGIDTSVIGDYPNLRRFLAEFEKSRQFLIINAIAFQGEADKARAVGKGRQLALSGPDAVAVTLKIEMETFFRKEQ